MANSKGGQGHKDKYHDTSTKILSQETLMCNIKAWIFMILLWITFIFLLKIFQMSSQKFQYQQRDLIIRNIHVKYENSDTINCL